MTALYIVLAIVTIICLTIAYCTYQKEKTERKIEQLEFDRNLPENNCNHEMEVIHKFEYKENQDGFLLPKVVLTCSKCGFTKSIIH